ncbi:MAG: AgmX/PglI C-terminal domain-containing protein [Pseudomonadota bacterium]
MSAAVALPAFPLPWDIGREDVRRFRSLLIGCLLVVTIGGIAIPLLPVPEVERETLEELPPQLARILLEKPKAKPVPPPPKPEIKKEQPKPVEPPKEQPKPKLEKPKPKPEPKLNVDRAREKAASSGLLQFKDAFADMREAVDSSKLQATGAIASGAGQAATIDRSLLTSKHSARSAGVNVAALSSDTGGVALSGRETTRVDAPRQSTGERGARKPKVVDARARSIEEIRRIFDANKGAIFAIYNRALRKDPSLQGKVVLELVIDPNGRVKDCKVVASELADDAVIAKIINRIKLFDFGTRDVSTTTISYPVHFLPS